LVPPAVLMRARRVSRRDRASRQRGGRGVQKLESYLKPATPKIDNYQLSIINYQLSIIKHPLDTI
ncbi:hypothetical protein C7B77_25760, partial [Chamaesiphon polymorphus CCALA 037]